MAVLPVLRMGNPLLLQRATEVTNFNSSELDQLIINMLDTMHSEDGAGLAAPQIGVSQRVVVFGFEQNPRYPEEAPVPATILINPIIKIVDHYQETGWEGCLSVPGLRGKVARYRSIEYRGYDAKGAESCTMATGFHARIVQHECDHLDGILYPQRMQDLKHLGYIDELISSGQLT